MQLCKYDGSTSCYFSILVAPVRNEFNEIILYILDFDQLNEYDDDEDFSFKKGIKLHDFF